MKNLRMLLMAIVFTISSLFVMPVFSSEQNQPQPRQPQIQIEDENEMYAVRRRRYRAPTKRRYRHKRRTTRRYRAPRRSHGHRHGGCFIGALQQD